MSVLKSEKNVLSAPCCLAVGVSRADSSTDTGRVSSSVDVSEGHHSGQAVAVGVVGAGCGGDTSGPLGGLPKTIVFRKY